MFEQKLLYSGQSGCIRGKWLYLVKIVVLGQRWLSSKKSGFYRTKVVCIRAKWSLSRQLVVFVKKLLYFGKVAVIGQSGCIRVKWLYLGGVVVFGKVVVLGHMCFHSGKVVVFGQKVFVFGQICCI